MNEIREKYLPIGSVVMLKGGKKRLMITGFCAIPEEEPNQIFDYSGCMYPEGFLSSSQTGLFNHEQIETVYSLGFSDDEEKQFQVRLKELVKQQLQNNSSGS